MTDLMPSESPTALSAPANEDDAVLGSAVLSALRRVEGDDEDYDDAKVNAAPKLRAPFVADGCDEDICTIRLRVKQNIEALPRTEVLRQVLRRHEKVREKEQQLESKEADADDSVIWWEDPKSRNEGRRTSVPFDAQGRPASVEERKPYPEELDPTVDPASVAEKRPRPEELDPTIDPSSTTRTKRSASSSVAPAATNAATYPTDIIVTNENDSESSGVSGASAIGGILEAASVQAGSSTTGMQAQVKGPPVVAKKKTKQGKKCKSTKVKTIAELLSGVLSSDVATVEGALDALLEKKLWKNRRKELRDEVLNRGGCMVGIQALRAPLGSRLIQRKACQFLIAISHEREDIKRIILNPDGLVLIVNAMKANIANVDLQHAACNALHRLGIWESDQEKVLHAGVIATLIAVAKAHDTDVYICQNVCRMLELIGAKSAALVKLIMDAGGFIMAGHVYTTHYLKNDELEKAASSLMSSLMKR
jgi:hypothetical protein